MLIKQTIKLHLFLILASIIVSLITTYCYFDWFEHKRYFKTIEKVVKVQADIFEGIAKIEGINSLADKNIKSFKEIFEPLRCLAPAKIIMKGQPNKEIYSNIPDEKQRTTPGICLRYLYDFDNPDWIKTIPVGKYEIKFGKYDTPNWWKTYKRWISNPHQWAKSWLDRYTVIFFIHVGFLYLLLWALCVRINEHFLSKEISPLLKDLEKLKANF